MTYRTGRRNGQAYEVLDDGKVIASYPVTEALANEKLMSAIKRNNWEPIHNGEEITGGDQRID